jgi:hypothetical protein
MNTPSILLTITLSILLLFLPRRFFFFPFIMAMCFVPMNQRFIIGGLDFTILRVLILVGLLRVILNHETRSIQWNNFDKLILSWNIIGSAIYIIQWANFSAVVNKSGVMFDCLGFYWLSRHAIREWEDIFQPIKIFAIFSIITAPLIALEKFQETSFFSIFGPVQGQFHRERFRCAGPFPHFIMMGAFWASLLPFFYARIKSDNTALLYWAAILTALSNVYFSASSTPIVHSTPLIGDLRQFIIPVKTDTYQS